MIANYHVHTKRCRHAIGDDEEYIKKAIAEGIKVLGFSDHAPFIYPTGYESYYKMTPAESGEYFSSLNTLREKYKNEIEIHIGYEAEYYPELWNETLSFWEKTNKPEYLILGQHFITEEYAKKPVHAATGTDREDMLRLYVDKVIAGINTDKFTYVAHPDVISFFGDVKLYEKEMERLIAATTKKNVPIEINMLGLAEKRNYPNETFWEIASEYNPGVILGFDAHEPWRVADKAEISKALAFASKYGLNIIDKIDLVNPFE